MAIRLSGHRLWSALAALFICAGAAQAQAPALPSDRMAVHYINVDQGSATLLEFPCGSVLIDAGGRNSASTDHLIAYLDSYFARRTDLGRRLDAVFLTHNHQDHDRALMRVAQNFRIRGYVHNGTSRSPTSGAERMLRHARTATPRIRVRPVTSADIAVSGPQGVGGPVVDPLACARVNPRIRVLSGGHGTNPGWGSGEFRNPNNHSLVIRVDYGAASFLFTGDLELAGIATLLTRTSGTRALDVGVYVAGHHGADNGTTSPMLDAMTPEIAVISMGPPTPIGGGSAWKHGHPRRVTIELLEAAIGRSRAAPITVMVAEGSETFAPLDHPLVDAIYGTGWDGDIVISAGPDGVLAVTTLP